MREILFRGKRLDNGGWSIGDLLQYRSGETIIHSYVNGCRVADAVDPSTVGQYTGLKDKNGKRIFEEDIVKTSDITHEGVIQIPGESFEIAMRKGCWVMVAGEDWGFLETNRECIEVIGNIHETRNCWKEAGSDGSYLSGNQPL